MFKRIIIKEWRQFSEIDILFHSNLTVLTGANGAGKTTILNLLSRHFGWDLKFVSTYEENEKKQLIYKSSIHDAFEKSFIQEQPMMAPKISKNKIGEIQYSNGNISDIVLPDSVGQTYFASIEQQQSVSGIYINSHRPTFPYRAINSIPTQVLSRQDIFNKYLEFTKTFVNDTYRDREKLSSTGLIKETIASLAMFGYGNKAVSSNEQAKNLFEGYENILKKVLPTKLGFKKLKVQVPEVILCTTTGDFPIDAVSGGISSIIDITWQLYMYADPTEKFVVIIDEPENHLHPELQKSFLNNLVNVFPNVQFIIATHNPFMISAVKDSNVYVLNYSQESKVSSLLLDYVNRAGTSNAILREVLGIDSSMPFWAESKLAETIERYSKLELTNESINNMRRELSEIGLDESVPEAIVKVVEDK